MIEILILILIWIYLVGAMLIFMAVQESARKPILWRQLLISLGWPVMMPILFIWFSFVGYSINGKK